MISIDKKKRSTSGPKTKSKKSKINELSVDLKPKPNLNIFHNQQINLRNKTQNSTSLNKSKPSRKVSKQYKKHIKTSKDSKDHSHSVSADRKHSLTKMNKTEANYEHEDIEKRVMNLKRSLSRIERPKCTNLKIMQQYYKEIKQQIETTSEPLYSICMYLHQLYLTPILNTMQMISPYEDLIRRKEQITELIDEQVTQNEQLYSHLDPIDQEIFQLKEKIQDQRILIEEKRKHKADKIQRHQDLFQKIQEDQKIMKKNKHFDIEIESKSIEKAEIQGVSLGIKGFKLDLEGMNKNNQGVGFHDQFYSKIDEFSQSWRNQALKEKRF